MTDYKTDLEIAREANKKPIIDLAKEKLSISDQDLIPYGHYKAKINSNFLDKVEKDSELARVHYVQSYKKYNAMNTFDPWDVGEEESSSHCCTIF